MLKTIQEYATIKGTSQQNIRNKKSLPIVDLPIFALYKGNYVQVGSKKFIEFENDSPVNQQVIK